MAPDPSTRLQAFFHRGVFRGICPNCNAEHDFAPSKFSTPTIPYTCKCGREYTVLPLGLRGGHRKAVSLSGSLAVNGAKGAERLPCMIRDISIKGIGIMLDMLNADTSGPLQLRVKLDDKRNTALLLPCTVSRRFRDGNVLMLGLKFDRLDLDSESALSRYLSQ